jgi:hypothetical protein
MHHQNSSFSNMANGYGVFGPLGSAGLKLKERLQAKTTAVP